jgi:hypothetical protein
MGRKLTDLTGRTFGRLTAVSYAENSRWNVVCSCGNERVIQGGHLTSGNTQSCGCLRNNADKHRVVKQRKRKEKVYDRPKRSVGRPKLPESIYQRIIDLYNKGLSYREIQQHIKVSLRTISATINENPEKLTRQQYTPFDNKRRKESE